MVVIKLMDFNDSGFQLEKLFWLVFHNKYLLNHIIKQIHINDWHHFYDYKLYNVNNRIRFKHIHSLDWMVENDQIELLKCKLNANEDITLSDSSIRKIFDRYERINKSGNSENNSSNNSISNNTQNNNYQYYKDNQLLSVLELVLKLYSKNNKNINNRIIITRFYNISINNPNKHSLLELMKQYINNYNSCNSGSKVGQDLLDQSINSFSLSQPVKEAAGTSRKTESLYKTNNPIILSTDQIDIDISLRKKLPNRVFNFESLELADYAFKRYLELFPSSKHELIYIIYSKLCEKAILNCDLEVMQRIYSLNGEYIHLSWDSHGFTGFNGLNGIRGNKDSGDCGNDSNAIENVNNLLKYSNSFIKDINHQLFIIIKIVQTFSLTQLINEIKFSISKKLIEEIMFEKIIVNSKIYKIGIEDQNKFFKFILLRYQDYLVDINSIEKRLFFCSDPLFNSNREVVFDENIDLYFNQGKDNYCKLIKFWAQEYIDDNNSRVLSFIREIVNFYFKRLISCKEMNKEILFYYYQFIKNHKIQIYHTLFHSFHYIRIKSVKLLAYIMSRPFLYHGMSSIGLLSQFSSSNGPIDELDMNTENQESTKYYDIRKYLDPNRFTFQYIFNSSFDCILESLVRELSIKPTLEIYQIYKNYSTISFSKDLKYYLDTNRNDLFLESILKYKEYNQKQQQEQLKNQPNYQYYIYQLQEQTGNDSDTDYDSIGNCIFGFIFPNENYYLKNVNLELQNDIQLFEKYDLVQMIALASRDLSWLENVIQILCDGESYQFNYKLIQKLLGDLYILKRKDLISFLESKLNNYKSH